MPKIANRPHSRYSLEAVALLGELIRIARTDQKITAENLAERLGVSRPLLRRIERGDPGCAIGSVFEAAAIVGVPLFESDRDALTMRRQEVRSRLTLLPKSVRHSTKATMDDF